MNADSDGVYHLDTSDSKKMKHWLERNPQVKKKNVINFLAFLAVSILC